MNELIPKEALTNEQEDFLLEQKRHNDEENGEVANN